MALDPSIAKFLKLPGSEILAPLPGVTAAMMRAGITASVPVTSLPDIYQIKNFTIPSNSGSIKTRLYRPSAKPNLPLVIFFHGGGFVLCDLETHDMLCRQLALASGFVIAAIDYRLAPENPFPGAVNDCFDALIFCVSEANTLSIDPSRIALAGDSAGANLAITVAMMTRAQGGPQIRHIALAYPMLDPKCDSESMLKMARGYYISRELIQWFWAQYLSNKADETNPLAAPLCANDYSRLPSTTILTAEYDVLKDEADTLGDRLLQAGNIVIRRCYKGMIHGFLTMPLLTHFALQAISDLAEDLKEALQSEKNE